MNPTPVVAAPRTLRRLRRGAVRLTESLPRRMVARAERRLQARISALAGDRYAASNRRLSELIDLDLVRYGYLVLAGEREASRVEDFGPAGLSGSGYS